jgi:hypothetical protein
MSDKELESKQPLSPATFALTHYGLGGYLRRKMIKVEVYNCNNITSANIKLLKNHLNIRYAMNGTGKSTIARAIELISRNESLSVLKPFDSDTEPTGTLSEAVTKIRFAAKQTWYGRSNSKCRR